MKTIEANTLKDAYLDAAKEFDCSITALEINVVQNSSSGFLGMFKKTAIIKVSKKENVKFRRNKKEKHDKNLREEDTRVKQNKQKKILSKNQREEKQKHKPKGKTQEMSYSKRAQVREPKKQVLKINIEKAVKQIDEDINRLFKESCFEMDSIKVSKYNEDTILLEFCGTDAALLIGKEGYRYKALSYFLYNWINIKYGANIRLEIAEFLKNQEEMIAKYLIPVIQRVKTNGRGQTKVLDGVLIKIALEKLRSEFSEKYVGIKSARSGGRFIVINDFNRKTK